MISTSKNQNGNLIDSKSLTSIVEKLVKDQISEYAVGLKTCQEDVRSLTTRVTTCETTISMVHSEVKNVQQNLEELKTRVSDLPTKDTLNEFGAKLSDDMLKGFAALLNRQNI